MPTGKVKFYDVDKGFGFLSRDDGGDDVFVRSAALPEGVPSLKPGTRVEFGVAAGRKGDQALQVIILEVPPSLAAVHRRPAEELHGMIDDLIKMMEAKLQPILRRDRYPDKKDAKQFADMLHAIAKELEG